MHLASYVYFFLLKIGLHVNFSKRIISIVIHNNDSKHIASKENMQEKNSAMLTTTLLLWAIKVCRKGHGLQARTIWEEVYKHLKIEIN